MYTEKQLIDWLLKQPDERPVDMRKGYISPDCTGCIMAEFLKDHGYNKGWIRVDGHLGFNEEEKIIQLETVSNIFHLFENNQTKGDTMGELKQQLRKT